MNKETLTRLAKLADLLAPYSDPIFPPSPYYRFLQVLAEELDSRLSVELGVCGGGGSFHLARRSKQAIGIDIADVRLEYPGHIEYIKKWYPNFEFIMGDSIQLAPIIYNRYGEIDLLFIDTTHTYEQTMAEYYAYLPYLSSKACVCFDDLFRDGMDLAWDELPETKVRFDFLHPSQSPTDGGFGVVWK